MNCSEAKLVPILEVCERLSAEKVKVNYDKGYALFHAPYREDKHPSLMLDLRTNRWCDLATNQSGDTIDLVRLTMDLNTGEALAYLAGTPVMYKKMPKQKEKEELDNFTIKPLTHPALLSYIASRGITPNLARHFCLEALWLNKGKHLFAIAFPSISGGYELRNSFFKGCHGSKDVSLIGNGKIFLFYEGFFDFMTHVELNGYNNDALYIVLNSIANLRRALSLLANYSSPISVESWLDNDAAGKDAYRVIVSKWPGALDCSMNFQPYKDLNEYLCHRYINKDYH